jgi:hypothetical protein
MEGNMVFQECYKPCIYTWDIQCRKPTVIRHITENMKCDTENNNNNNNNKWKNKVMHGQYIRNIDRQLISEEDRFLWLSKGDLKAETDSEIVAAQDQPIKTKYYATKLLNTETDSKCRLCQQFDETIDHIISACPHNGKRTVYKMTR